MVQLTKRINSKTKGSSFENIIAKKLSKAFAPLNFKRVQSSGAITGGSNAKNNWKFSSKMLSAFVGDLFVANEDDVFQSEQWKFKFSIECKFYAESDNFSALFKNPKILTWWTQALTDSAKVNKEPLLICKFNHTPIFIGFKCESPTTISRIIQINDLKLCLFDEAILDSNWWKQI